MRPRSLVPFIFAWLACKEAPSRPVYVATTDGAPPSPSALLEFPVIPTPSTATSLASSAASTSASSAPSVAPSTSVSTAPSASASAKKKPKAKADPGVDAPPAILRKTSFAFDAITPAGSLEKDALKAALVTMRGRLRFCGAPQGVAKPGSVVVSVSIDASGGATSASPIGGTLDDPSVRACIAAVLQDADWPAPTGDVDASVKVVVTLQ